LLIRDLPPTKELKMPRPRWPGAGKRASGEILQS
jgi:hypothetical protein